MPGKKPTNSKAEAGRARKAEQAALKAEQEAKKAEEREAQEWQKGSNVRGQARSEAAAAKADEAAKRRKEKADLLAAEEANMGSGGKAKKTSALSKKKGKKKNDLSLLEDALVSQAEKKSKTKKQAEQLRKEKEEAALKAKQAASETPIDPLLQNTNQMIEGAVGREANKKAMETASGLDAALTSLDVGDGADVKRRKALYLAFEAKMLPVVKSDYPGLRLTQYKEKVFNLWKKSPENPANAQ